jgi:hypothetical protein
MHDRLNNPDVATLRARQEVRKLATPVLPKNVEFSPSRWPYTYAYDHVRGRHARGPGDMSRGEAALYVRELCDAAVLPRELVVEILATAYCHEHRIEIPSGWTRL